MTENDGLKPGESIDHAAIQKTAAEGANEAQLARISKLTQEGKGMTLSSQEARYQTLQNNLKLQASLLDPEIAKQSVRQEQAKFEATFDLAVTQTRTVSAATNPTGGESVGVEANVFSAVPSLSLPLRTGGTASLDWTIGSYTSVTETRTNSTAESVVAFNIQQPLLRDAGFDYNESSIVLAQAQAGAADASTQYAVINAILEVETAYWNLYLAWQALHIQYDIYTYTKKVLDDTRTLVNKGVGTISSVYNFEVSLAQVVSSLVTAEKTVHTATRGLKTLMQDPNISLDTSVTIELTSKPILRIYEFDKQKLVDTAIANRADLLELEFKQIEAAVSVLAAKNQLLPDVSLTGGYTFNGFDGGSGSIQTANSQLFNGGFTGTPQSGWSVGLSASVPIGNEAAIAAYQSALLSRLQAIANTRQQEFTVSTDVLNAIDTLQSGWEQILVSRYQVIAAERNLQAMQNLFQMGQRTSNDLATAISLQARARIASATADAEYQIYLAQLATSTGCLLGQSGVEWKTLSNHQLLEKAAPMPIPIPGDVAGEENAELSNPNLTPSKNDDE